MSNSRNLICALPLLLVVAVPATAELYSWVDESGVTHFVDTAERAPGPAREQPLEDADALRALWGRELLGAPTQAQEGRSVEQARIRRLLQAAEQDLERGESARGRAALEDVLRRDAHQPDAHWLLARAARASGHHDVTRTHLEAFLAAAGDGDEPRRREAARQLAELADEQRLADAGSLVTDARWVDVEHPHFRVHYDAALASASDDYAATVLGFLEAAHEDVGRRLGWSPREPLGVLFYGKASYARAHQHRFSFRTAGFFDGRIHVVSPAHPSDQLRALLFHEYTHAVFRERTGGDQPYWLNEGLAELSERASRQEPALTRTERSWLRRRIAADRWIPLRRLAPDFAGLDDEDARAAYQQATAAATWIERNSTPEQIQRLLLAIGAGHTDDEALFQVLGLDTEALDRSVREWIESEFAPARFEL